jgi:hypothetical protein
MKLPQSNDLRAMGTVEVALMHVEQFLPVRMFCTSLAARRGQRAVQCLATANRFNLPSLVFVARLAH